MWFKWRASRQRENGGIGVVVLMSCLHHKSFLMRLEQATRNQLKPVWIYSNHLHFWKFPNLFSFLPVKLSMKGYFQ